MPTGEIHINDVLEKDIPKTATEVQIVERSLFLVNEMDFNNAFVWDGSQLVVDIDKAKEVTKNRLRQEREPLLAAQDIAFQRALETNSETSTIVAEKQRLRDITKLVDAVSSLDELRALKVGA